MVRATSWPGSSHRVLAIGRALDRFPDRFDQGYGGASHTAQIAPNGINDYVVEGIEDVEMPARIQVMQEGANADQHAERNGTKDHQLDECNEEPEEVPGADDSRLVPTEA